MNREVIPLQTFPDGTLNLLNVGTSLDYLGSHDLTVTHSVVFEWKFENVAEQVMLYNLVKHVRGRGVKEVYLILPYIPNARMDRVHDVKHEVHTLKYFADFINDLDFRAVFVLDPHSDVSCSMINNVTVLDRKVIFDKAVALSKPDVIFYPDAGSQKRYSKDSGDIPYLFGDKDRDWKTGEIRCLIVKNPMELDSSTFKDMKVLVSDDISSRGGTFYFSGVELKKLGFREIDLFVTHCENTIYKGKLMTPNSPINHIYTTDSLFKMNGGGTEDKWVTVLTLDDILEGIYNELL